mgnify:CR=1 FL=1
MADHRRDRVAHLLHHELADLLLRETSDPRLAGVTITAVRLTADLGLARIYYRILGASAERAGVARALRGATAFLRTQVGRRLGLRAIPELRFVFDTVPDTAARVETLLGTIGSDRVGADEDR